MGWNWAHKRKEIRQRGMRYLLAYGLDTGSPIGFLNFLYTTEEDAEGHSRRVAYVYELQLEAPHQGMGIGTALLARLASILVSDREAPKQIMLTCFTANVGAIRFYCRHGFCVDSISPSMCNIADSGYEILSKVLHPKG